MIPTEYIKNTTFSHQCSESREQCSSHHLHCVYTIIFLLVYYFIQSPLIVLVVDTLTLATHWLTVKFGVFRTTFAFAQLIFEYQRNS